MVKNMRTRRNKKSRRRNKITRSTKIYGGNPTTTNVNTDTDTNTNTDKNENDKLINEIENKHSLGNSNIFKQITELSEGLALKTMDNTAEFFDVDLNDSDKFKQRLEELKIILNDPKNKKLMRELVANFAEIGIIALEASSPFIEKLIVEIFNKLTIMGNEFGKAGVKIGLNTMEEVPGYGVIIGTVRSASNAAEAVLASTNAASEIITISSDNMNAATQSFDKLLKEKKEVIDRTNKSIVDFSDNMKSMPSQPQVAGKPQTAEIKIKNKTRKNVRFNI
jgi:hypothetical protein